MRSAVTIFRVEQKEERFPWLARLKHFTWANFTLPMATGGLALLLAEEDQGFTFPGLQTIGKVVYVLDLVIFTLTVAAITYRFAMFPGTLKKSVVHPTEGLFLGTSTLSLASIISGIARYGIPFCGPWLVTVYRVLFWLYFALTFIIAVGQYALLFTSPKLKLSDMTPAWNLPSFSFMLLGTIAATGAGSQPPDQAVPIIVAGLGAQGFGLLVSVFIYACYVARLIQYGFPAPNSRPGMFIAVGPPAFTGLALIGLANNFPMHDNVFGPDEITIQMLRVLATTVVSSFRGLFSSLGCNLRAPEVSRTHVSEHVSRASELFKRAITDSRHHSVSSYGF